MKPFIQAVILAGLVAVAATPAEADPITAFHVQLSTSALIGNPSAPFFLDFTLTDGSGTLAGPNTVVINNFTFGGGSPVGSPTLTGGVTGNLSSSVTLSDNASFLNELFQQFTPGSSLGFNVSMTTNADPVSPDAFSVAILDKNFVNLPTNGLGDSLVLANISPLLTLGTVQTSSTMSPVGVNATATPIPEPASMVLLGTGIAAIVRARRPRSARGNS